MSIRNRIVYGYGLSLGLALLGVGTGLILGNHYQSQALADQSRALEERRLLSKLQILILYNRPAKQLTPYVDNPPKFEQEAQALLGRIQAIEKLLSEQQSPSTIPGLQAQLDNYQGTVKNFLNYFNDKVLPSIEAAMQSPDGGAEAQKLVVELVKSKQFGAFISFPDKLAPYYQQAQDRAVIAQTAFGKAEVLRTQIIVSSLLIATLVGMVLAWYISKKIAQPIQDLTDVAQQVTQASNFELRAPITDPNDEVGLLAASFNQLIERVNQLIQTQLAYTEEIEQAKEMAESANHAKSRFLANMSHELRTPLNGILGYTQILSRSDLTATQTQGLNVIGNCGSHLLSLINDVLDLAKVEAGKLDLDPRPCHLPALLQGVMEMTRVRAEQKQLTFTGDLPRELPEGVMIDEKRLRQVLLNLLNNAVKFTHDGMVSLAVEMGGIEGDQVHLVFHVRDSGVGMTPEQLETIFLPFEQVGSQKQRSEGTGLGLAITQSLVELMGGTLTVTSELHQGSCFSFDLRCSLAQDWAKQKTLTRQGHIIGYHGDRRAVLIVDDRWENRSVVTNLLEPLGFAVTEAEDGQDALEYLQEHRVDLIISDLKMPRLSGLELLQALLADPQLKDIPVIISSASAFMEDYQASIAAGGKDFLPKPIDAEELYRCVAKYLQLSWIYEESAPAANVVLATPDDTCILPPLATLEMLQTLAQQGKISELDQALDNLARESDDYQLFITPIKLKAQDFNLVAVRQLLKAAIGEKVAGVDAAPETPSPLSAGEARNA